MLEILIGFALQLVGLLAWPTVILLVLYTANKRVEALIALRKPMSDEYYDKLTARIDLLERQLNSIITLSGFK